MSIDAAFDPDHLVVETQQGRVRGQRMPDMQAAGDIGRRNHDAIGVALAAGLEVTLLLPALIPLLFNTLGLIGLIHEAYNLWQTVAGVWR